MVPESVRWLLGAGRVEEATEIIAKAERVNKVIIQPIFSKPLSIASSVLENTAHSKSSEVKSTILDLFRITKIQVNELMFLLGHN